MVHIDDMCCLLNLITRNKGKEGLEGKMQNQDNSQMLWIPLFYQHKLAQQTL